MDASQPLHLNGTPTPGNNASKTRGKPFEPGNPGRPKGARHRITVLAEKLMEEDAERVVKAVITAAAAGDMTAARLVMDRIAPIRKGRPITFTLPEIETVDHITQALGAVCGLMASGDLSPEEASVVVSVIDAKRKAIETADLERRLAKLEERANGIGGAT